MEAVFGKETEIEIPKEETCDTCDGSGAKKGTSAKTCTHCGGSGQISVTQDTPLGQMVKRRACHHCQGTGKIIPEKCATCHGAGTVKKRKKLKLQFLKVSMMVNSYAYQGQGEPGRKWWTSRRFIYCIPCEISMTDLIREEDDIYLELSLYIRSSSTWR